MARLGRDSVSHRLARGERRFEVGEEHGGVVSSVSRAAARRRQLR